MNKQLLSILTISLALSASAQGLKYEQDTIKMQEIEDIRLHKTGNPNKSRKST
ncbi:MAG: hypothetical protein JST62_09920, partial [Bacteroidetes bacterium]|nr:hypothetical protein [Bacteroidota bacterium]